MSNYSKNLGVSAGGHAMVANPVPFKALQQFGAGGGVSSVITLHDNATNLEVTALGIETSGVAIRWIPATESAAVSPFASVTANDANANYDHVVPVGVTRTFVIPKETQGVNSVVGLGVQNGLYRRVAFIQTNVAASVYATTY